MYKKRGYRTRYRTRYRTGGDKAGEGCLKLLVSATMKLFKDTGFYAVEVAMARLNEIALRRLIKGGETATVEFKVAVPRPVELAERLCGMANAQGGMIIIGVEDRSEEHTSELQSR